MYSRTLLTGQYGNHQVIGCGEKEHKSGQSEDITDGGVVPIADINKFKQSLSVHPVTMTTS